MRLAGDESAADLPCLPGGPSRAPQEEAAPSQNCFPMGLSRDRIPIVPPIQWLVQVVFSAVPAAPPAWSLVARDGLDPVS